VGQAGEEAVQPLEINVCPGRLPARSAGRGCGRRLRRNSLRLRPQSLAYCSGKSLLMF